MANPRVKSILPAAGDPGETLSGVALAGVQTNFAQGVSAVSFSDPSVAAANVQVRDLLNLTMDVSIGVAASPGSLDVTVTTDLEVALGPGLFSVTAPIAGADIGTNPFLGTYLPDLFWPAQIATFGRRVDYLPQGNAAALLTIAVLWKEGASDEEVSPGRYSHMDVQNSDLPAPPALRDLVQKDGKQFQVVRVEALAIGFSIIVLEEAGPVL